MPGNDVCPDCGEPTEMLLPIRILEEHSWGKEWKEVWVCPFCWEVYVNNYLGRNDDTKEKEEAPEDQPEPGPEPEGFGTYIPEFNIELYRNLSA